MALRLLGEPPIDIHAGGVDLIFPHHENEIAQSEGATGKPFSRFWVHVEHLMIEEDDRAPEKMSKSLGNVFNLADIVAQGFRPSALRYLYLGTHYRKQLKFSWTRWRRRKRRSSGSPTSWRGSTRLPAEAGPRGDPPTRRTEAAARVREHIAADLNTAAALGIMFDLVRALNSSIDAGELAQADAAAVRADVRASSTRCSACCRCAGARTSGRRCRSRRSSSSSRRAAPPARPQLRRSRPHPKGPRRARHPARRHRRGDAVEESDRRAAKLQDEITMTRCQDDAPDIKTAAARARRPKRSSTRTQVRLPLLHARLSARHRARARGRWSRTSTATSSSTAPPGSR